MRLGRKCLDVILFLTLLSSLTMRGQTTFDEHFALAKSGQMGPREAAFAKRCGVDRASAVITYGRSLDQTWTFKPVASVGRGRDDAEMDFLGNAELWSIAGKPRFLNVWFLVMDVGSSRNEVFCLDEAGRVTQQESLNVYEPVDGSGIGWRRLVTRNLGLHGRSQVLRSGFLNKSGNPIASPKLTKEDLADATRISSPHLATEVIAEMSKKPE